MQIPRGGSLAQPKRRVNLPYGREVGGRARGRVQELLQTPVEIRIAK